jgi:hypothetical protein
VIEDGVIEITYVEGCVVDRCVVAVTAVCGGIHDCQVGSLLTVMA